MVVTCFAWYLGQLLLHTSKCARHNVTYTVQHYIGQSVVVCDRYGSSASTTAAEQQRHVTQSITADILLECAMKTTIIHKALLANSNNKYRLIDKLTTELLPTCVLVKQDPADADQLIVSTALTLAQTDRKLVIVVATYTDLLVMFIYQSPSDMDIYMLCHTNPLRLRLYNTDWWITIICW